MRKRTLAMSKHLSLVLLLLIPVLGAAANISVGGAAISIPNPAGYAPVTSKMIRLYELQKNFVPPKNVEFVAFIPEKDVPSALMGEVPTLPRRFTVQSAKNIVSRPLSSANFAELKKAVKTRFEDVTQNLEKQMPGLSARLNQDLRESDLKTAFSIMAMVALSVHEETDRSITYSAFVKYQMTEQGRSQEMVAVVTQTTVLVNGRILFLYAHGAQNDLAWTRAAASQWLKSILAANPEQ